MNYLESRLNEIETIKAYNIDGRKEIFTQQLIKQGFHDGDTFTLYLHLSKLILPRLKRYVELEGGYPGNLTKKQWEKILNKMVIAFELLCNDEVFYEKENNIKINEGLKFFGKYFRHLWW